MFEVSLREYGDSNPNQPEDWFDAFLRLKQLLNTDSVKKDPLSGRRVIFLDEIPWMDTAKSDYRSTLDYFWNSWASTHNDICLIVCGSAAS